MIRHNGHGMVVAIGLLLAAGLMMAGCAGGGESSAGGIQDRESPTGDVAVAKVGKAKGYEVWADQAGDAPTWMSEAIAGVEADAVVEDDAMVAAHEATVETPQEIAVEVAVAETAAAEPQADAAIDPLVGKWALSKRDDDWPKYFPTDLELCADGTVVAPELRVESDDEDEVQASLSLTWKAENGTLVVSVVIHNEGTVLFTMTVTLDYTQSGSTITLFNGRCVVDQNGESQDMRINGQATYKKSGS